MSDTVSALILQDGEVRCDVDQAILQDTNCTLGKVDF
jgi:hypothetical protein